MGGVTCCGMRQGGVCILERSMPERMALAHNGSKFPMYVMSVADALSLNELLHHQELREQGLLRLWTPGLLTIFVSHQWMGFKHPDADKAQFHVLQMALANLLRGLKVEMCAITAEVFQQTESYLTRAECKRLEDAYIWYDYFCVPQVAPYVDVVVQDHRGKVAQPEFKPIVDQMTAAVDSLPIYVQHSDHFFVLAPSGAHSDTGDAVNLESWVKRGWCRLEMCSHFLSLKEKPTCIMVTGSDRVTETFPFAWVHNQPLQGQFSVESDRDRMADILRHVCGCKLSHLASHIKVFERRLLTALDHWLSRRPLEVAMPEWLKVYGFGSMLEAGQLGWAPVHFAAVEGNLDILTLLLVAGESVNRKTAGGSAPPGGVVDLSLQLPEMTPLMCAVFYIPNGSHASTVTQFLVQRGASVTMTAGGGDTVLHLAAAGAAADGAVVDLLLDARANPEVVNDCNETPLLKACFSCPAGSKFPNQECAEQLVRRGATLDANSLRPIQPSPLRCAAGTAGTHFVRFLLDHRADVNGSGDYLSSPSDFEMTSIPKCIRQSSMRKSVDRLHGATPLHWAAHFGNKEAVEALLHAGADHNARNFMGHTAVDVAKFENHTGVLESLTGMPRCRGSAW